MILLNRRVITASSDSSKQQGLRLCVPHEPAISAPNREVLKSLDPRMVRSYLLIVVVVEILYFGVLEIGIRVTLRDILQCLVEAVTVAVVITCRLNDSPPVPSHWRDALV